MVQTAVTPPFHFDSHTAELMSRAFDAAWELLQKSGSVYAQPYKADQTREAITFKLIELARDGEFDCDRMVVRALADLSLLPPVQAADVSEPPVALGA